MRKKQWRRVKKALILAHLRKVRDVSPIDAHLLLRQERNTLQLGGATGEPARRQRENRPNVPRLL